jgi:hypothetical protein
MIKIKQLNKIRKTIQDIDKKVRKEIDNLKKKSTLKF